jgi:hypothetical protein
MYCQKFKYQSLDGCYLREADFYQTRCLFQNGDDCTADPRKFALGLTNTVQDAKTRFLQAVWSSTLERDSEKPGFFGKPAIATDIVSGSI